LVHRLHFLRQPGRQLGPERERYFRRHPLLDTPGFIAAQLAGALAATALFRWLLPAVPETSADIIIPRERGENRNPANP
jgi:hypothetical protein